MIVPHPALLARRCRALRPLHTCFIRQETADSIPK